jgi:quinol monooxygenase YgiN
MASEPVQNILKLFQAEPQLLGGAGEVLNLEPKSGFTRPEVKDHPSPYIGFATLDYKEGTVTSALNGWNGIADYAQKHESGALSYNVMKNKGNENQLRLLEVYESESYHWDTHEKSGVVARNRESQANNKTATKHVWLKIVGGYLTKESPLPNL